MMKTHKGSCHCGKVQFEADLDLTKGAGRCNCSFCAKQRAWSVTFKPEQFRLSAGKEFLASYQFNTMSGPHHFCKNCGTKLFAEGDVPAIGGKFVTVAITCLDDVTPAEFAAIPITYFDGKHDKWMNTPEITSYL